MGISENEGGLRDVSMKRGDLKHLEKWLPHETILNGIRIFLVGGIVEKKTKFLNQF